ncbi:hypothetical protein SDC9_182107 [bioreactor metagenome]|uniref:Uncharacterized protein n=1 Tax=bioreactor metagenome TaxID=1076179 RepID=A0A645HG18_9ZZZZ
MKGFSFKSIWMLQIIIETKEDMRKPRKPNFKRPNGIVINNVDNAPMIEFQNNIL